MVELAEGVLKRNGSTSEAILIHLQAVDEDFLPPLSWRVNLRSYSQKLANHAERFEIWSANANEPSGLLALVAAYFNPATRLVFISNVSVLKSHCSRGYGSKLLTTCVEFAQQNQMTVIQLEVAKMDKGSIDFYQKNGFSTVCSSPTARHQTEFLTLERIL